MRIGVGLSIPELATRGGRFSPASLFTAGTVGAWYDPSDYSTLFQDSAGTTPVTAVEQPVGLMLDKSQGLVLGSELVTNGDFSSGAGWTLSGAGVSITGGQLVFNAAGATQYAFQAILTVGKTYKVTYSVSGYTTGVFRVAAGGTNGTSVSANGTFSEYITCTTNANFYLITASGTNTYNIDNVSVRELPGNHASQATAASRPVLRARYNQLTYSEQFDNAAWAKNAMTVTTNQTVAPDGTTTADALIPTAISAIHHTGSSLPISIVGVNTFSVYAKANGYQYVQLMWGSGTDYANFNLSGAGSVSQNSGGSPSIQSVGNGWYRCLITSTLASISAVYILPVQTGTETRFASTTGDGTSGIYVWGADLRTGSSAGTYQRIAAATDYATAGFLPYLYFVTDDSFSTGSINFTGTNKMSVCAGVTKLSDGGAGNYGCIAELSADVSANLGTFNLFGPASAPGGTPDFGFSSKGSLGAAAAATGNAAPVTRVLTGQGDIAADVCVLRVNAANAATSSSDQGTGNFGNYPLYIGRRNNTLYPFNGNLYGLIVAGKTLSASELSATESWMAAKTGVTL